MKGQVNDMDLKDIAKNIDKEDVEKAVDTVKDGAKKLGINDLNDVKEKVDDIKDKLKK